MISLSNGRFNLLLDLHLLTLLLQKFGSLSQYVDQTILLFTIFLDGCKSFDIFLSLLSQPSHCLLNLKSTVLVFEEERVNIENSRKVKGVIDFLRSKSSLIIDNSVNLKE